MPLFQFPKTCRSAKTIGSQEENIIQKRIHLNAETYQSWDSPTFPEEHEAIKRWEKKYGVVFKPGQGMARYDSGSEGVRP